MTEKNKRVKVALTVGAVLLFVILICVMVYQLLAIGVQRARAEELNNAIADYNTKYSEATDTYEARSARWWIIQRARELGYSFDGEKIYED